MLPGDRVEVLPGQPQQHRGLDGDDVDDRWLAADQRDLADGGAGPQLSDRRHPQVLHQRQVLDVAQARCSRCLRSRRRGSVRSRHSRYRAWDLGRSRRDVGLGQDEPRESARRDRAVRQQIGVVPQHPYIFGATIRENIALTAPHASTERIQHTAAIAALDTDIAQLPMGLDTQVSDGGASLSGGQRQRIALSRAVLREPSVLLLDEATSALDTATEARITANLARLRATRIIVAHRLSTVANADLIVVMHKGRIVETGTHASLLARRGTYHHLVAAAGGAAHPNPSSKEMPHAHAAARSLADGLHARPRHLA
jgi:ABC-type polar amino acid transport system ATPase subunit